MWILELTEYTQQYILCSRLIFFSGDFSFLIDFLLIKITDQLFTKTACLLFGDDSSGNYYLKRKYRASLVVQCLPAQCSRHRFNPQSGKIPLRLCAAIIEPVPQLSPWAQLLSPCATTAEACAPQNLCSVAREATSVRSPCTTTRTQPLLATTREKATQSNEDPSTAPAPTQKEKENISE